MAGLRPRRLPSRPVPENQPGTVHRPVAAVLPGAVIFPYPQTSPCPNSPRDEGRLVFVTVCPGFPGPHHKKFIKVLGIVHIQFIYYIMCIRAIGFTQQTDKLEFARRAGGQVVTGVVRNRSQPDPLGIVLLCGKIGNLKRKVRAPNNTVIPNQCALLSWESPSNSRRPIVIQSVLICRFPGFIHEKWYVYPGDCHASVRYFIAMTGNSPNSNLYTAFL